jgi:hypothetical protein
MTTWMAGSLVTSTATFVSNQPGQVGQVADPTTITLKYVAPGGTVQTVVYPNALITRVSQGIYSAEFDSTGKAGPWTVEWIGTGNVQAIDAATWTITSAVL